ncbi:hypothetical protein KDAU_11090 [Dictyobacter aurantiacus]|uniref:Uncharacterized protein n=1 Tax=Dictyobacter aurantiacus TaxID=1936993 RepID=A0A401ZA81_9CHLR|nr:hypothetical protein KDAU_11090 [Dictyobacter aurantiacus]
MSIEGSSDLEPFLPHDDMAGKALIDTDRQIYALAENVLTNACGSDIIISVSERQ